MTTKRKMPTSRGLRACLGKTVRYFMENIDCEAIQIYKGGEIVANDHTIGAYLDCTIEYVYVSYPEGRSVGKVYISEVDA